MFTAAVHAIVGEIPPFPGLSPDEALLLQLALKTLPSSDTASVTTDTLLGFVRHSLRLRENSPYCRELPEDLFLHYVFYPRINTEDLVDCRSFFHSLLQPRIEGLPLRDAVLEVNRWCAEQVTYRASDDRTENPLTAYRSGTGRCGEESTFTVTALRSVGIAARQIYVPFWAHCDDNHAWVEVWVDGGWHYLGACEPEPVLDRGWFTDAASRAPLACCRRFFDYAPTQPEQFIGAEGCCLRYNVIHHYAHAAPLTLRVEDAAGRPVPGAPVRLSVVNMAALREIACLTTGPDGSCSALLTDVTVHAEVITGQGSACAECTLTGSTELTLTLGVPEQPRDFDCSAPAAAPRSGAAVTDAQRAENSSLLSRCAAARSLRAKQRQRPEYTLTSPRWQQLLALAGDNAAELYPLSQEPEQGWYLRMLTELPQKDLRDTSARLLRDHLAAAMPYRQEPLFFEEILCPRVETELLTPWRSSILSALSSEQQERFRRDPEALMAHLCASFPDGDGRYYPALAMVPEAVLRLGCTDDRGRKLLFTAAARTLGIPARLNPVDGSAEYYRDGAYHAVPARADAACLQLLPEAGKRFVYGVNYTLSRRESSGWQILKDPGSLYLQLQPGQYRLLTANRLPNGSQLCRLRCFTLAPGQKLALELTLREPLPEQMLSSGTVEPFCLCHPCGTELSSRQLLQGTTVLVWLEVTKEPTEHILNELTAAADALHSRMARGLRLICILRSEEDAADPTFLRLREALPEAEIFFSDFGPDTEVLARKLFLEPGVWPLLLLTDESHRGYYGTCGYQVGTAELTLKLADCIL